MIKDLNTVKYILLGMVTLFFAVSCSNDDDPEPSDNSGNGSGSGGSLSSISLDNESELSKGKGQFAGVGDIQFTNKNASASWDHTIGSQRIFNDDTSKTLSLNELIIEGKEGNNKLTVNFKIVDSLSEKEPEADTFDLGLSKSEKLSDSVSQWATVEAETNNGSYDDQIDTKGEVVVTQKNNDTLIGHLSATNLEKFGTDSTVNVKATFNAPKE